MASKAPLHLIERTNGRVPIAAVRAQFDASRWSFDRDFMDRIGMPAKRYARLIRLHQVLPLLKSELDLASVAIATGFYDQAHLAKETAAFCGHTPLGLRQLSSPHGYTAMIAADR